MADSTYGRRYVAAVATLAVVGFLVMVVMYAAGTPPLAMVAVAILLGLVWPHTDQWPWVMIGRREIHRG